jgi:hypothetical protein
VDWFENLGIIMMDVLSPVLRWFDPLFFLRR